MAILNSGFFQPRKTNNVATLLPGIKDDTPTYSLGGQNTKVPTLGGVKPVTTVQSPSSGVSGSSGSSSNASLLAAYQQQLADAQRRAEEAAAKKQQLAQNAYDKNVAALNAAMGNRETAMNSSYQEALKQLESDYGASAETVNKNADKALQEAYINKMLTQKSLPQQLAAMGISGGAAESTLAGVENSYGNSRNQTEESRGGYLGELLRTLNSNKSSAMQEYNNQKANDEATKLNYMMQFENNLANQLAQLETDKLDAFGSIEDKYASALSALKSSSRATGNSVAQAAADITADNQVQKVSTEDIGGQSAQKLTNAQAVALTKSGNMSPAAISILRNSGYSDDYISSLYYNAGKTPQEIAAFLNR